MKASELIKQLDPTAQQSVREFKEGLRQQALVSDFEKCNHCSSLLVYRYQKDSAKQLMLEHAECVSCQTKAPSRLYKIC